MNPVPLPQGRISAATERQIGRPRSFHANPMAARLNQIYEQDGQFYTIIRDALVAYLQGHSAPIAVEIARGNVPTEVQPSFHEMDEHLNTLPADPLAA